MSRKKMMSRLVGCSMALCVFSVATAQGVKTVDAPYPMTAPSSQGVTTANQPFMTPVHAPATKVAVSNPAGQTKDSMSVARSELVAHAKTWSIKNEDIRLAVTFERWAKDAGHRLIWDAKKHVQLSAADSFTGTLEEAMQRVLSSPAIRKSEYPLEACIYPNVPPVIRITRLGEQTEECSK